MLAQVASAISVPELLPRAWYCAAAAEFIKADPQAVLGSLTQHSSGEITEGQRNAWLEEIEILRTVLTSGQGHLCLEFEIPRMGHRADAVILAGGVVIVVEFKSSEDATPKAVQQVWDYALDLKNFHEASHGARILPVVVHPGGGGATSIRWADDGVACPFTVGPRGLATLLTEAAALTCELIRPAEWLAARYRPTPAIVDAARALYAGHTVADIARSEAAGDDLRHTCERILELVSQAREQHRKLICFVTGVPGAGKTLVGLNLATGQTDSEGHTVYLSGNGPLVEVLRAALQWDANNRAHPPGRDNPPGKISQEIKSFIQNVHHFRDEQLRNSRPPHEHVAVFDEAQRAWNQRALSNFMKRRKGIANFDRSEPETLLADMDRHEDWAVTVCLVGSGQEILPGEAGIGTWLEALCTPNFADWSVYLPQTISGAEFDASEALARIRMRPNVHWDDSLHLAVSVRSFRAENLSTFVQALLGLDSAVARSELKRMQGRFPIALSRNLEGAKQWVREHARGSERYGLLATSKALRLKPHAIDVRVAVNPVHWFLHGAEDTRSSFYLEDAATEFQVQGLELDWACVTWDGDLRYAGDGWTHHDFRGSTWNNVHQSWRQTYVRNAYRVLLTRARQGMAIFVPPGNSADPTRNPTYYDGTFQYLAGLGVPVLD